MGNHQHRSNLWLVPILGTLVFLGGCSQTSTEDSLAEKEQQLAELKDQVAQMEKELEGDRRVQEMREQIAEMENELVESKEPAAARSAPPPPEPEPITITLAQGTPIVVRTMTEISTKVAATGDRFVASLEEPLMDGMTLIAGKGADVYGQVVHSDKGGKVKGRASLEFRVQSITGDDGQPIEVTTDTVGLTAKKSTKKDALKVGIGTGIGAAIGAIAGGGKGAAIGAAAGAGAGTGAVLLTRGNAAVLPAESVLNFQLDAPATITRQP